MSIKPRNNNINTADNKCFHAELTSDYSLNSYNPIQLTNERLIQPIEHTQYGICEYNGNEVIIENKLRNPSEKHPMSIAEFLGNYLDVSPVKSIFEKEYGTVNYHYRLPLDAMIKSAMMRRICCMRSFQKLVNRFKANPHDAELIGFRNNGDGKLKIPDRRTFCHWENVRNDLKTLRIAMDKMVITLRKELENNGVTLGKNIGIDSTPLDSLFNDTDAGFSGHYSRSGFKIHGAYDLDTNIPLAIIITPMHKHDSDYLRPLLSKLHHCGIKFEKVFADGAYDSYDHFALVHIIHKARFYTNLGKNSKFNENGTIESIQHEYNKLRDKDDFLPPDQLNLTEKLQFLLKYGKTECVGAYFRNQLLMKWKKWKIQKKMGKKILYNSRNGVEGYHGFVKQYLNLQNYFDYRGLRNVERHVRWTYLAILGVALARVQNGITKDLTQIAFFE